MLATQKASLSGPHAPTAGTSQAQRFELDIVPIRPPCLQHLGVLSTVQGVQRELLLKDLSIELKLCDMASAAKLLLLAAVLAAVACRSSARELKQPQQGKPSCERAGAPCACGFLGSDLC